MRRTSPDQPHLVLVGLMGVGKSTIGAECGRRLERPFVDIDTIIEEQEGITVSELFSSRGESTFRDREREVIARVLASTDSQIVAPGGGAVLDPGSRKLFRSQAIVVWLQAPVEVLVHRIGEGATRPLLDDSPADTLHRLEQERDHAYREVAHVVVSSAHGSVAETTDAVLAAYAATVRQLGEAGCNA